MASSLVLDVREVTKSWPNTPTPTVSRVDLQVEPGALLLVEGANGAGKTTLLRLVAGLIEPDEGQIRLCGLSAGDERVEYQRRLGVVPAGNAGLYARLNARQHLVFAARLYLVDWNRRRTTVADALSRFELEGFGDRRVDRLSMGQRQRLRLAMAFLHEPAVVLLDEPSNSLDVSGQTILERAVESHLERGGGAVWFVPTGSGEPALAHTRLVLDQGALKAA